MGLSNRFVPGVHLSQECASLQSANHERNVASDKMLSFLRFLIVKKENYWAAPPMCSIVFPTLTPITKMSSLRSLSIAAVTSRVSVTLDQIHSRLPLYSPKIQRAWNEVLRQPVRIRSE